MEKFRIDGTKEAISEWKKLNTEFNESATSLLKIVEVSQKASQEFKKIGNIKGFSKFQKESEQNIKKLTVGTNELTTSQKRLESATKNLQVAQSQEAKQIQEVRVRTSELNKTNKLAARESLGLVGSYNKLSQELVKNRVAAKNAAVQYGTNSKQFKRLRTEVRRTDAQLKSIDKTLGQGTRSVGLYGGALASVGRNLLSSLGIVGGLTAFVGILRKSFSTIREFELQIATLGGISRASAEDLKILSDEALRLGASTQFTAGQVAELQTEFARLGFDPQQIIGLTEATLDAATALDAGLGDTAKLVGGTLKAFDLDVSESARVVDVLAGATQRSALDFSKLQTALGVVAPVAKNAGVSLEQTAASLGILVDRNVDASTASTGLRNIFLEVAARGITVKDAFNQINSAADKNAKALELFGKRGATVGTILAENSKQAAQLAQDLSLAGGSARELAEKRLDTLDGSLKLLNSAWEGFILNVNESTNGSGVLADAVRFLANNLETILNTIKNSAIVWGTYRIAILAARKASLLYAAGVRAVGVAQLFLNGGLKNVIKTFRALNAVSKANIFGAIAAGVTALILVFKQFSKEVDIAAKNQQNLKDINDEVTKSVGKEKNELGLLLKVARDENISKEDRLKAIEKINNISPEYLGNITLETINTDETTDAIGRYVKALDRKARAQAIANKLQKLNDQLLDAETKSLEDNLSFLDKAKSSILGSISPTLAATSAIKDGLETRNAEVDIIKQQIDALDELTKSKIASGEIDIDDLIPGASEAQSGSRSSSGSGNRDAANDAIALQLFLKEQELKIQEEIRDNEENLLLKRVQANRDATVLQLDILDIATEQRLAKVKAGSDAETLILEQAQAKRVSIQENSAKKIASFSSNDALFKSVEENNKKIVDNTIGATDEQIEALKDYNQKVIDLNKKTAEEQELIFQQQRDALQSTLTSLGETVGISGDAISTAFDLIDGRFETAGDKVQAFGAIASEVFNSIFEASNNRLQASLDNLEVEREAALDNEQLTSEQREQIEEQFDQKKRVLQRRQAQNEKKAAITSSIINTCVAGVKALPNIPLSITIGALGLIQTALIAAQPIPQFATGTLNAPEGIAKTDERGAEIHTDRLGNIKDFGSDKGARYKKLEKGDKIFTAQKTKQILSKNVGFENIMQSISLNGIYPKLDIPKQEISYNGITVDQMKDVMTSTLAKQPKHLTVLDKNGVNQYYKKGNSLIKKRNNPYGL